MGSRLYLTLAAIVAIIYGLGFLLIPATVVALYGGLVEPHVLLNARFFGAALLGLGVVEWLAKDFRDRDAVRGVLIGAAIGDALVGLVNVSGSIQGLLNALSWSSTILVILLLAGALYCLATNGRRAA